MENKEMEQLFVEYMQGLKAKEVYQALKEFFEEYRKRLYNQWRLAKEEEWKRIKCELDFMDNFEGMLEAFIEAGNQAIEIINSATVNDKNFE